MKRYQLIPVIAMSILLLAGCGSSEKTENTESAASKESTANEKYSLEQDKIMESMMKDMEEIPGTDSAELDFFNGMIPHHKSAIDMAESYLKYADKDAEFKPLAEEIIRAQNDEITEMNTMITRFKDNGASDKGLKDACEEEYKNMMTGHENHSMQGDSLDISFAQGMSLQHQMAVDMAEYIMKFTKDEEMLRFAGRIIEVQNQEIAQMQTFVEEVGTSGSHHSNSAR